MLGTIINVVAILVGGGIGLLFHKKTPENIGERIMEGFGIFVIVVGIEGAIGGSTPLLYIFSILIGALIGEVLNLDKKLDGFTDFLKAKLKTKDEKNFKEGFISTTILFCIGAMAIVGPFEAVLQNNYDIIFIKSALDGVTAFIFASSYGISVLISAGSVLIYQGLISFLALFLKNFLSMDIINAMSVIGSLLVAAIGINMLNLSKKRINVVNLLPAVFVPILYGAILPLINYIKGLF